MTLTVTLAVTLSLGFKVGAGEARQSGWEERVLLRETLKKRPRMRILFHMAAQFDYKAQWLTWVPFDHFWHMGKVWRCARLPLSRPGRPPLLVENMTRWLADVRQIQADPFGFQARTDGRVCIRWDLESSPWRCCPHATGVAYAWRDGALWPMLHAHTNASAALRETLSLAAKQARAQTRERSYDICQEGAFFHAGLTPRRDGGGVAPRCTKGTWALQDDIGGDARAPCLLRAVPPSPLSFPYPRCEHRVAPGRIDWPQPYSPLSPWPAARLQLRPEDRPHHRGPVPRRPLLRHATVTARGVRILSSPKARTAVAWCGRELGYPTIAQKARPSWLVCISVSSES